MQIPVIDIAPFFSRDPADRLRVAQAWDEAFSTIGFATIAGHGISEALATEVHDITRAFFDRPLAEKMALQGPQGLGYEAFQAAKLSQSKGGVAPSALVKAQMIQGPEWDRRGTLQEGAPANLWPQNPPRFRETIGR